MSILSSYINQRQNAVISRLSGFAPEIVSRAPVRVAEQRLPDVIVAGVKKCGTGALIEILKLHQNIAAPEYEKTENPLFDDVSWARGLPDFISKMARASPEQLVLTKSQSLISYPDQDIINTKLQERQVLKLLNSFKTFDKLLQSSSNI